VQGLVMQANSLMEENKHHTPRVHSKVTEMRRRVLKRCWLQGTDEAIHDIQKAFIRLYRQVQLLEYCCLT
jgi:hypothetical protein